LPSHTIGRPVFSSRRLVGPARRWLLAGAAGAAGLWAASLPGCASATGGEGNADGPGATEAPPVAASAASDAGAPGADQAPASPPAATAKTDPPAAAPAAAQPAAQPAVQPVVQAPTDPYAQLGYRQAWASFSATPAGRTVQTVDVLADGTVVVTDTGGVASGLWGGGGRLLWASNLDIPITRFLGAFDDGPRVGVVADRRVYFVDKQQQTIVAVQQLERAVSTAPLRFESALLLGSGSGFASAHNVSTGFQSWAYAVGGALNTAPVLVGSDAAAFASDSGNVLIVDARSGRSLGRAGLYSGPAAPLAAAPDAVFVASRDRSLYALERAGAGERWRLRCDAPLRFAPVYAGGVLYCWLPGRGLSAIDPSNGQVRWSASDVSGAVVTTRGGRLVVWSAPEAVLLDAAKGTVLARVKLEDADRLLSDKATEGNLYAVSASGRVAKYQAR
jgi:outer membrane protein assembly factor BamB